MFGAIGRCPACNKYHDRCTCNGKVPQQVDNLADVLKARPAEKVTMAQVQAAFDLHRDLTDCTANVATLYKDCEPIEWWIERTGSIDFICDQLVGDGDTFQPGYRFRVPDYLFQLGYFGYHL